MAPLIVLSLVCHFACILFSASIFCACLVRSYACTMSFACIFCVNLVHSYACISYLLAYLL